MFLLETLELVVEVRLLVAFELSQMILIVLHSVGQFLAVLLQKARILEVDLFLRGVVFSFELAAKIDLVQSASFFELRRERAIIVGRAGAIRTCLSCF